jgi:hypothetical protein
VDSKISAGWSGQRLGWAVRLSIFLMAAVAIAAVCAGAVPATGGAATDGAATAARAQKPKHRLCSALFPTAKIEQITALDTTAVKPIPTNGPPHGDSYWRASPAGAVPVQGELPGSLCLWLDKNPPGPPWGADYGLQNTAWVAVGYGESNKNWGKYRALTKASGLFQFSLPARYRSIKVGYRSQAFLATVDLWGYYSIAPGTAVAGFPHYLYDITVFSRHHNVLEVAFMTASLANTVGEIDKILKTSF